MFPILEIGGLAVKASGFFYLISLTTGIWVMGKFAKNLQTNGDAIENGFLTAFIAGLIGARVGFLLQNPSIFTNDPLTIVSISPSMFNTAFGLLTALIVLVIIVQKKHLPLWPTLDTITPVLALFYLGLHLANLATGAGYGFATTLPWGIELWGAQRHPTQIYGLVLGGLVFGVMLYQTKGFQTTGFLKSGVLFLLSTAGLAFSQVILQGFTADKTTLLGLDLIQIVSLIILTAALYGAYRKLYSGEKIQRKAFISLGSNLNPEANLKQALEKIQQEVTILQKSKRRVSDDVKGQGQDFHNILITIETAATYPVLYKQMKAIEAEMGREPGNKTEVVIDIDFLTFGDSVFVHNGRAIPDPELYKYAYLVRSLAEIAPNFRHPGTGESITDILESLKKAET